MKLLIALTATLMVAACGGKNSMIVSHTIQPTNPAEKATADCQNAEMGVWRLVEKSPIYQGKTSIPLGNGGCAVAILVNSATNVIGMLDPIRESSSSYSYYSNDTAKTLINVWIQQTPMAFKDSKGNVIDTSPANADCNTARDKLTALFDGVSFLTVIDRKGAAGPRRCYVDAVFTGPNHKTNFEHFMAWNNPGGNHEPFNYYLTDGTSPRVVYIHAVDAVQK